MSLGGVSAKSQTLARLSVLFSEQIEYPEGFVFGNHGSKSTVWRQLEAIDAIVGNFVKCHRIRLLILGL